MVRGTSEEIEARGGEKVRVRTPLRPGQRGVKNIETQRDFT